MVTSSHDGYFGNPLLNSNKEFDVTKDVIMVKYYGRHSGLGVLIRIRAKSFKDDDHVTNKNEDKTEEVVTYVGKLNAFQPQGPSSGVDSKNTQNILN